MTTSWNSVILRYLCIAAVGSVVIAGGTALLGRSGPAPAVQPAPPPTAPVPRRAPAPLPARPAASRARPFPKWGVVRNSTVKAYNDSGKFLRRLAAGTLVELSEVRPHGDGDLAVCSVDQGGRMVAGVLVRLRDIETRPGPLDAASDTEKELRSRRAMLADRLREASSRETAAAVDPPNPHADAYRSAKATYEEFWREVTALQRKRDAAQGAEHVRYSDMLRQMKGDDIRIGKAYEAAKERYDAWQPRPRAGRAEPDPATARMRAELAAIDERLAALPR